MKTFGPTDDQLNKLCLEEGKEIYFKLRDKFPENSVKDMDTILNSLCVALSCHMYQNVDKDNHPYIIQIIYKILTENHTGGKGGMPAGGK